MIDLSRFLIQSYLFVVENALRSACCPCALTSKAFLGICWSCSIFKRGWPSGRRLVKVSLLQGKVPPFRDSQQGLKCPIQLAFQDRTGWSSLWVPNYVISSPEVSLHTGITHWRFTGRHLSQMMLRWRRQGEERPKPWIKVDPEMGSNPSVSPPMSWGFLFGQRANVIVI